MSQVSTLVVFSPVRLLDRAPSEACRLILASRTPTGSRSQRRQGEFVDHNRARAGAAVVPLSVARIPEAAASPITQLTLEVSFDDGVTWQRMLVLRRATMPWRSCFTRRAPRSPRCARPPPAPRATAWSRR